MLQPSLTMASFEQAAGRAARTPTLHGLLKAVGDPGGLVADADRQALADRAARNYPDSPYLQAEYIRAVGVVRGTRNGWVMDLKPLPPVPSRFQ